MTTVPDLAAFLSSHRSVVEGWAVWRGGALRLVLRSYVTSEPPPRTYVTSVRSIVLRGSEVLTLRNDHEVHVLPGGRCEAGESEEQTLAREVMEESGCTIERPMRLGFIHLHHLTPEPSDYPYPYPDFVWAIYASEAVAFDEHARSVDDDEKEAVFKPVEETSALDLSEESRLFLATALAMMR